MNEAAARTRIEDDVQWEVVPALTSEEVDRLLERALTTDTYGRQPGENGYVDTFSKRSVRLATGIGWLWKAAKAVALTDVTVGDVSISGRSNLHAMCMSMAQKFGGGVTSSIGTITTPTVLSDDRNIDLTVPGVRIDE